MLGLDTKLGVIDNNNDVFAGSLQSMERLPKSRLKDLPTIKDLRFVNEHQSIILNPRRIEAAKSFSSEVHGAHRSQHYD
ncbi:MAG: hypothetical protein EBV17_03175, partial [Actinobacteria bacterium]|nr:hypothetical protein [Actinomycetota bacterium]